MFFLNFISQFTHVYSSEEVQYFSHHGVWGTLAEVGENSMLQKCILPMGTSDFNNCLSSQKDFLNVD